MNGTSVLYVNGVKACESADFQTIMRLAEKAIANGDAILIKAKEKDEGK